MNSGADLGGTDGFGPIPYRREEPRFHDDWERKVFGVDLAVEALGLVPTDAVRFGVENRPPDQYLQMSYYERWLASLEWVLAEWGVLDRDDIAGEAPEPEATPGAVDCDALVERIVAAVHRGEPKTRPVELTPRFAPGATVRARRIQPKGHTRLPRYARGCVGEVEHVHGVFVLPDSVAHGLGEAPQHLYSVRFDLREIWADRVEGPGTLHLDLYDTYLEPA